jgi:hypothetical protein
MLLTAQVAAAEDAAAKLERSVQELRHSVGQWSTTTEFLNDDGSVARKAEGTYRFDWVVPDRVVSGRSEIPELGLGSAILFYVSEGKGVIEMVSVGADGNLWVMTGALGGDTRTTQPFATAGGGNSQLRFTRYAVTADRFESRMEYTEDGGATWKPGNRQVFRRIAAAG